MQTQKQKVINVQYIAEQDLLPTQIASRILYSQEANNNKREKLNLFKGVSDGTQIIVKEYKLEEQPNRVADELQEDANQKGKDANSPLYTETMLTLSPRADQLNSEEDVAIRHEENVSPSFGRITDFNEKHDLTNQEASEDQRIEIKVEFNKKVGKLKLNEDLNVMPKNDDSQQSNEREHTPKSKLQKQLKIKELKFDN